MGATHLSGLAIGLNASSLPGSNVSYWEKGTVSINPASLLTTAEADTSVTITGAATGDLILMCPPTAGLTAGIELCGAWVSAADTVKVRLRNNTGGTIDEPAGTWTYMLIKSV